LNIRKLHTIDSTNSYLKKWAKSDYLENYTLVISDEQTEGRGQRGNHWLSEKDKNLTFSILVRLSNFKASRQFELNQAISLGLLAAIREQTLRKTTHNCNFSIKWPNDIMAGNKKIAGILIENSLRNTDIKHSVVGIGLNVNQTKFPITLPHADALINCTQQTFNLDDLLASISKHIQQYCTKLTESASLKKEYLQNLYLLKTEANYKDVQNREFTGRIIGITSSGKLQIENKNKTLIFGFKEVSFLP